MQYGLTCCLTDLLGIFLFLFRFSNLFLSVKHTQIILREIKPNLCKWMQMYANNLATCWLYDWNPWSGYIMQV